MAVGSRVAIGTAMMVALGFPPFTAAIVALVGFSHPGVWSPMGLPVVVLQSVSTGLDVDRLGALIGQQVPLLTLLAAPVTVVLVAGWSGLREVWLVTVANGLVFAIVTGLVANYVSVYIA
ncbi:MAG: L-lactate permease, partial [Candidatus Rokuibacteriota bacterium]